MMTGQKCVECKQWIPAGKLKCSCGCPIAKAEITSPADFNCQYQNKGRRCILPGTMNHSTHKGGIWYCSYHYQSLGDPQQGEEFLDYIEKNYQEIMDERISWRDKLFPEMYAKEKSKMKRPI